MHGLSSTLIASPETPPRRNDRGHTLLELLVALTIIAALTAILAEAAAFVGQSYRLGIDRNDAATRDQRGLALMRRALQELTPVRGRATANAPASIAFDGTARAIAFVAPTPMTAGAPAALARIVMRPSDDGTALTLHTAPFIDELNFSVSRDETDRWRSRILVDGLVAVEFSYFGPRQNSTLRDWRSTWRDEAGPPERIRIMLRREGRPPLSLVVAPRNDG